MNTQSETTCNICSSELAEALVQCSNRIELEVSTRTTINGIGITIDLKQRIFKRAPKVKFDFYQPYLFDFFFI
jgi:hypothetical protein